LFVHVAEKPQKTPIAYAKNALMEKMHLWEKALNTSNMTRMNRNSTAYAFNTITRKRNWRGAVNSISAYLSDALKSKWNSIN